MFTIHRSLQVYECSACTRFTAIRTLQVNEDRMRPNANLSRVVHSVNAVKQLLEF